MRTSELIKDVSLSGPLRPFVEEITRAYLFSKDFRLRARAYENMRDDSGPLTWDSIEINQRRVYVHFVQNIGEGVVEVKRVDVCEVPESHIRYFQSYHLIKIASNDKPIFWDNSGISLAE